MKTRKRNRAYHILVVLMLLMSVDNLHSQEKEKAPECLNLAEVKKMLIYPDSAKINFIEGSVRIKLLIGRNGEVIKFGPMTGEEIFYNEVKRVSVFLKFSTAIYNYEKVKCWVTVPFTFKLEEPE